MHPFEEDAIENLQNLRNHIHLTRMLTDGDVSTKFNRQFVEDMLRLYYVTINQAEMNHWYYDEQNPCLRELDDDAYSTTEKQQICSRKEHNTDKIILACIDMFYGKTITEKNKFFLNKLSNTKNLNTKCFTDEMGKWLYFEGAHFRTEKAYQDALNNLNKKLQPYLPRESDLLQQIADRIKYYHKLFNSVE